MLAGDGRSHWGMGGVERLLKGEPLVPRPAERAPDGARAIPCLLEGVRRPEHRALTQARADEREADGQPLDEPAGHARDRRADEAPG